MKEDEIEITGYAFFVELDDNDDSPPKVICVKDRRAYIDNWISIDPKVVFIFWSNNIQEFIQFFTTSQVYKLDFDITTINLNPMLVMKTENKIEII